MKAWVSRLDPRKGKQDCCYWHGRYTNFFLGPDAVAVELSYNQLDPLVWQRLTNMLKHVAIT